MYLVVLLISLVLAWTRPITAEHRQQPLGDQTGPPKTAETRPTVAIIGAGITGVSAAYVHHGHSRLRPNFNITVFERESYVGGRVKSIPVPQAPYLRVEAGAQYFTSDDRCLDYLIVDSGLTWGPFNLLQDPYTMAVWNGRGLQPISKCESKIPSWADLWRYGVSTWKFRRAVNDMSHKFREFAYKSRFYNINMELVHSFLDQLVSEAATNSLKQIPISARYASEFVEPCIRARFSQNLRDVHGLTSLMGAQGADPITLPGGMGELIWRLIKLSDAEMRLNTQVTAIGNGINRRYKISYSSSSSSSSDTVQQEEFDVVVLATSLSGSHIDLANLSQVHISTLPDYTTVHVTLFSTSATLSPDYFNLPNDTIMTDELLTTSNTTHPLDILSITHSLSYHIHQEPHHPNKMSNHQPFTEMVYRVVSRDPIPDSDLVQMIGREYNDSLPLSDQGITWTHRQPWPYAIPRFQRHSALLENIEIAPNLFYLGGADEVVSSLEMGCRMGSNMAEILSWSRF